MSNSIQFSNPIVEEHIKSLVEKIPQAQQKREFFSLLIRFYSIFDTTKYNIARTPIPHVINTIPHSPPASRPYPQPDKEDAMYKLVQEFLEAGLITESNSPYAAPAILLKKKDNSFRSVVDYKRLNAITIKDSSPLPNMEDTVQKLGKGFSYFSKLDLKSGFYQIPINDSDKEKTAFVTPFGLYQFNVLPMGLRNSPPTFQKVMTDTLKSCRQFCLVYLDDIIVFSKSFPDHLDHLRRVFLALQTKNLVLNPSKCQIAAQKIDYLGHTISKDCIKPMKDKIVAILRINEPRTLGQANRFVGALGWYRKFLPNFATIAAPIHAVTNLTKSNRRKFKWQHAQSEAFRQLKKMLTNEPLFLHYPVDELPLILTTDASDIGIGGVLQQKRYGHLRAISPPEGPFALLGIDYCGPLVRTPRENQYVLVITDYYTRHITAIALPNCTAVTTAQALFNDYFCKYGIPSVILSDRGSHFQNQLMENVKKLIGYNHIYSTAYHPQTNGVVERFNATFITQIAKLQNAQNNNWDEYLQAVVFAYNTGVHKSTKFSPYELLYGRPARLPIHAQPAQFTFRKPINYFEQLKKTLRIFHQASRDN
ncbi:unnamed protein product, partial [Rotaria magnacalcarata]